jgi:hypothetical protein
VEQGADADAEGLGAEEPLLQGGRPQHMGPIARLRAAAKRLKRRMTVLYYACKVRLLLKVCCCAARSACSRLGGEQLGRHVECPVCCGQADGLPPATR